MHQYGVSTNNSETVGHKDLRPEQIVQKLVFYNMSFSFSFSIPRIGLGFLWTIEATNGMYFLADNEYVRQLRYSKVAEFHRENLR